MLYVENDFRVPQTPQTNHSQYSSPVEALNLIVNSKSQPAELDSSTIELHVPSRRKKSLTETFSSVEFDFLALMRLDMTFDVTLLDDSSFGKLTNTCNIFKNVSFSLDYEQSLFFLSLSNKTHENAHARN